MEDFLALLFGVCVFGGGTFWLLSITPIGRALAERIRGGGAKPSGAELDRIKESQAALLEELEALRQEVAEVYERVDFAERLLTQRETLER
ncbi:MAG: hypothetical protein ACE5HT_01560 [Gemmatimonadales bacterium]